MNTTNLVPSGTPTATRDGPVASPTLSSSSPRSTRAKWSALLTRRSLWLVGALLVAGAVWFGYHWMFGAPKVVYATAPVTRGDVESTVVAAGVLQPVKYVDVGAQTSGRLKSLKVKRGDHVEENQLLAEIDPILADTALSSASATLANMTSVRSMKQAQLVLAKAQQTRNDSLFARLMISANDRDVTRAGYDVALADVAALSAQMKQATAAVDTAKANVGYTKITAPMAGDVVSITTLEGQTVNASQQAPNILRIADLSTMTVWAQVSEADIVRVKVGQDVYFTVLGQPRRWNGTVRQILPTPELINNVVFYDVLFDIPNPERALDIQMTAQVFIVLAQAKNVLLIPAAAVGNAARGARINVQVLNADGRLESRAITIGIKSELSAEVTSGLEENEQVVINGKTSAVQGAAKSPLTSRRGF
jgi:membrane fusion protein, macrolide-specific efflux system